MVRSFHIKYLKKRWLVDEYTLYLSLLGGLIALQRHFRYTHISTNARTASNTPCKEYLRTVRQILAAPTMFALRVYEKHTRSKFPSQLFMANFLTLKRIICSGLFYLLVLISNCQWIFFTCTRILQVYSPCPIRLDLQYITQDQESMQSFWPIKTPSPHHVITSTVRTRGSLRHLWSATFPQYSPDFLPVAESRWSDKASTRHYNG